MSSTCQDFTQSTVRLVMFCCCPVIFLISVQPFATTFSIQTPSSDVEKFRSLVKEAKNIVAITGAGISPVPANTAAWGDWRNFFATALDQQDIVENLPFLTWEFAHYRREVIAKAGPNAAQKALGDYERYLREEGRGRNLTIITLNTDGLHIQAGNTKVIELFGSLFKTQCVKCGEVRENRRQPIWPSLAGTGDPDAHQYTQAEEEAIPHCERLGCYGHLRPYILFENEDIPKPLLKIAEEAVAVADLCLVIGTSSTIKPISQYGPDLAHLGIPVAEFNLVDTSVSKQLQFQFKGNCTETLPLVLQP